MDAVCFSETLIHVPRSIHGVTTHEKNIVVVTALRSSNLATVRRFEVVTAVKTSCGLVLLLP
jgi:hypothetical protein